MEQEPLVLLVDDDGLVRRLLRQMLQAAGYRVEEADRGDRGLEAIRSLHPDLVLLDVMMPEMTGLEVCSRMRKDPDMADTPVLFLSTCDDIPTKAAGFQVGAQDFMSKGIDPLELKLRVKAALETKAQRDVLKEAASRLQTEAQRFQHQALVDPLTGLPNRRALMQTGATAMEEARFTQLPVSLLMVDVDHFKRVNDQFGHAAGDTILERVSTTLRGNLREEDMCARFGGEEFAAVLPRTDSVVAMKVAERIRRSVENMRFLLDGQGLQITISIGVASFPTDGGTLESVLEAADRRLYDAKAAGRNRVMPPASLIESSIIISRL